MQWDWLHAGTVDSMFLMTKAVLPGMIAAGGGSIPCNSSIPAVPATLMEVLHDTTRSAVHRFARAIAVEFHNRGIRCNALCPGFIEPPHGLREVADLQALGVDVSEAAIAMAWGRIGKPVEVAQAALFLASDEASFVDGARLFVDSGFTGVRVPLCRAEAFRYCASDIVSNRNGAFLGLSRTAQSNWHL